MQFELTAQQRKLRDQARVLAQEVIAARAVEVDRGEQYPWHNVQALTAAGFVGMTIPQAYGGLGLGFLDACQVIDPIAQVCGVTARIVVETNMGAISAVMQYGTEQQRRLAAELVLSGDKPAICITEPNAGSDAGNMQTSAHQTADGYILNGNKHWITGGGVSRLHLIFARVFDRQAKEQGIGGFLAVRDQTPGLIVGKREPTLGLRGIPETELWFKDMEIPMEHVLMPPGGFSRGFATLMNAYNSQRVGAATVALGIADGAYQLALQQAKTRIQFGRPLAEFQGLQWMLADMSTQLTAARLMIFAAAAGAVPFPDPTLAAQAKVFASEMAIRVTNDALQFFGASGYSRNLPLERMVRDARMFTIGGGTAQILRTLIGSRILGQKLPQTRDGYVHNT